MFAPAVEGAYNYLTRLLLSLADDVDIMISTLLRFEVVAECFDGGFLFIISFGRFWYRKGFENIAGLISNIMK